MRGRFNGRVVGQDYTGRNTRHNGRAGMYNAVQSAFAPSLDITLANGLGPLFIYTRATTATVKEGVDGLIKSCLSGELRIYGARRVYNLANANSTTTAGWTGTGGAGKSGNNTFTFDGTAGAYASLSSAIGIDGSVQRKFVFSARLSVPSGTKTVTMTLRDNSGGAGGGQVNDSITITTTPKRFSVYCAITSATNALGIRLTDGVGTTTSVIMDSWQVEETTGSSVSTVPSEEVSVGVLSSPYHGYFVDGVKYFSYQNGNTVASNVVTEAQGAAISGTIGYLDEGQRTNLALQSRTPATANWTTSNSTVLNGQALSVDGTTGMASVLNTTGTGRHGIFQITATNPTGQYTFAVDVKDKTGGKFVRVCINAATGDDFCYMTFNPRTGAITQAASNSAGGTFSGVTGTVEDCGGGIYRAKLTGTAASAITFLTVAYVQTGTAAEGTDYGYENYTGVSGDGCYIDFVQLEAGAFASTRIVTTTAAVTRNADVLSAPSAGILNSAAMTIAMRWSPIAASMGTVFLFGTYVDANNYTAILHDGTNIIARKRIAGVNHDATKALAYTANTTYRITARFDSANGCDIWVDGTKGTNDSTTTASQVGTNFQIGADGNGANQAFGVIPTFKVYRSGLSDTQAAAL